MSRSMLLVEGKSEKTVIPELCRLCGVRCDFTIEAKDSINQLKAAFKTLLKSSNTLDKLWVIIDADTNLDGAWQSIRDILLRSGRYTISKTMKLPADGAVILPDNPSHLTIGVWIMPNNTDVGMLEDFMATLIPDEDSLLPHACDITDKLDSERNIHAGLFKAVHLSKARIHTWLAWHDTPGQSLSVAVQKRLFATDKELSKRFAAWIDKLNP